MPMQVQVVLEELLEVVIDEVAVVDVGHEGLEVLIVVVDGFKELEEALDDLHVGLAEALIELDGGDVLLDAAIIVVLVFKIIKAKQDGLVFLELG